MCQPVYTSLVIYITDRPCLRFELLCIGPRPFIRRHAPALEELQKILLRRRTGQAHQILILVPRQSQLNPTRLRRPGRGPRISIHSCKEQICKLRIILIIRLKVISVIIGQMKLPVHSQLGKYIRSASLRTRSHLLVNLVILEPHTVICLFRLGKHGKIVISDLRNRIAALVDAVSDLMRNPPSEIISTLVSSLWICRQRITGYHTRRGTPFDSDVVAGRIHKCPRKHPLVPDVQMPGRIGVFHIHRRSIRFLGILCQSLMLIEQMHHVLHRLRRRQDPFCISSGPFQNLRCRKGKHHRIKHHIRCPQYAFALFIITVHRSQLGAFMQLLMLCLHALYICLQFFHICLRTFLPLGRVSHLIQIQKRDFRAAAHTYRILVRSTAACILHIQRAPGLALNRGKLWNRNIISSDLQVRRLLEHRAGLRMILCRDQLQIRTFAGFLRIMSHINRNLFPCRCRDSKRLPRVQPSESPVCILCRNAVVDIYRPA